MKLTTSLLTTIFVWGLATGCTETVRSFDVEDEDASVSTGKDDDDTGNKDDDVDGEDAGGEPDDDTDDDQVDDDDVGMDAGDDLGVDAGDDDLPPDDTMDASVRPPVDSGTSSVDSGTGPGADAGSTTCTKAFDCDDGVDCTIDECTVDGCTNTPDDALCTASAGGTCDAKNGCQYPTCDSETCSAGSCQTATCENGVCVRQSLCAADQVCCAGECVPMGCDDGLDCTTDSCGANGCEHTADDSACDDDNVCTTDSCDVSAGCVNDANTEPCDDGVFCNGPDTCANESCSSHAGDPCPGQSQCDENQGICSGCAGDGDCPADVVGGWSACDFGGTTCGEMGTQTRTVTAYSCNGGSCEATQSQEQQSCTRDTDGNICDDTIVGAYGDCVYADECVTMGERERDRTDYKCSNGLCAAQQSVEADACVRTTQGDPCGSGVCERCGASGQCDFMPVDDAQCQPVDCPSDTACTDWTDDFTTNRCESLGVCRDINDCSANHYGSNTLCGTCQACDGAGNCDETPADDASCGVIDCPSDTPCKNWQPDITNNRCESLGMCIDASACMFQAMPEHTKCDSVPESELQCDGQGNCRFPGVVCPEGNCYTGNCCYNGDGGLGCQAAPNKGGGGFCGGDDSLRVLCDEIADCQEGYACCGRWTDSLQAGGPLAAFSSSCQPRENTCNTDLGSRHAHWFCRADKDCPPGSGTCQLPKSPGPMGDFGYCSTKVLLQ